MELCLNLALYLAKTALNKWPDIALEVIKQPLCSVLAPLGTKTAHVCKSQNGSCRGQNGSTKITVLNPISNPNANLILTLRGGSLPRTHSQFSKLLQLVYCIYSQFEEEIRLGRFWYQREFYSCYILVFLIPFFLQEERFLFPIYPIICLAGAVALSSIQVFNFCLISLSISLQMCVIPRFCCTLQVLYFNSGQLPGN